MSKPHIPDHELFRPIGRGSYGEVWLARSVVGTFRAVKVVYRSAFDRDRPYEREFAGIQKFEPISRSHEGLVDVLQIGRNDAEGYFYYVMELADNAGQVPNPEFQHSDSAPKQSSSQSISITPETYCPRTLRHDLDRRCRLRLAECIDLGMAMTAALAHLHHHALVHRDVKPSNIIFVGGVPKLADIGLVAELTEARSFVGTDGFIPPEGPGSPSADLFSLGKALYELSTGLDRQDYPKLPPDLKDSAERPGLSELNEIIVKACANDPEERYTSAGAMRAELELLQGGHSIKRQRTWEKRCNHAKALGLSAIVLATVSVSAILSFRERNRIGPQSTRPEALVLYAQAKHQRQSSTWEEIFRANSNLLAAVKLDPTFLDAYYLLTETYYGNWGDRLPPNSNTRSNLQWVADQIHRLRPDSAQYHTVNAWIKCLDWRFDEALKEAELAAKLDPKFLRARGIYGGLSLCLRGDASTALREFRAAAEIDPADVTIQTHLGTPCYFLGDYTNAIAQFQRACLLEGRARMPRDLLAKAYEANQQYKESLDFYEAAEKLGGGDAKEIEAKFDRWRAVFGEKGPRGLWEAQLFDLKRSWPDPVELARRHARLGNTNEVFILLNKAWDERNGALRWLLVDDCWEPFRQDSQFKELLEKVGYSRVPGRMR